MGSSGSLGHARTRDLFAGKDANGSFLPDLQAIWLETCEQADHMQKNVKVALL
jgi:hypothetical protein